MIRTRTLLLIFSLAFLLASCSTSKKTTRPPADTSSMSERQFRREVVRYAEQWVGTSYKYAGSEPRTGFDCSGFTSYVLKQFKVTLSPSSSAQAKQGEAVGLNAVQPGDIVVFGKNPSNIQHVALVVERTGKGIEVVHSTTSRGVVRENVTESAYWRPLILSARNVIGRR
ncbi:MAG: NlpC/P60 family protein [Saprospiraceae bacterium]